MYCESIISSRDRNWIVRDIYGNKTNWLKSDLKNPILKQRKAQYLYYQKLKIEI